MFEWYDYLRMLNAIFCLICLYLLVRNWRWRGNTWGSKKMDGWYALCLWTFTGLVSSIEGIAQDTPLGSRTILVTAGALVTHRFLVRKPKDEVIDV